MSLGGPGSQGDKMIRWFKNLNFETRLSFLGLLFVGGYVAFGYLTYHTLNQIRTYDNPASQELFITESAFRLLALGAVVVALASIFSWLLARSFVKPLRKTMLVLEAVAGGDRRGGCKLTRRTKSGAWARLWIKA